MIDDLSLDTKLAILRADCIEASKVWVLTALPSALFLPPHNPIWSLIVRFSVSQNDNSMLRKSLARYVLRKSLARYPGVAE